MGKSTFLSAFFLTVALPLGASEYLGCVDGFEWWIPDIDQPVHGVLMPGWSDSVGHYNTLKNDPEWKLTAKRLNFAITWSGCGYSDQGSYGRGALVTARLQAAAKTLKHPELAHARVILTGLSGGARAAARGTYEIGDRALAHVEYHQAHYQDYYGFPNIFRIPVLRLAGNTDNYDGVVTTPGPDFESEWEAAAIRMAGGLPESASMDKTNHPSVGPQRFNALWIDAVARLRLPSNIVVGEAWTPVSLKTADYTGYWVGTCDSITAKNGSIADLINGAAIFAAGAGTPKAKGIIWLPNQRIATAWLAWVNGAHDNSVLPDDTTAPSGTVSGLTTSVVSAGRIDLAWTRANDSVDPDSGLGWYQVVRRKAGDSSTEQVIPVYGYRAENLIQSKLSAATAYEFSIAAVNRVGLVGPRSAWVSATTPIDTTPPQILSARALPDGSAIVATFDEPVDPVAAGNPAKYSIAGVSILTAVVGADGTSVTLSTSTLTDGTTYTLNLQGVADLSGNQSNASVSLIFRSGLEVWYSCEENTGTKLGDSSGNENSAVGQNLTWIAGPKGSALSFATGGTAVWLADQSGRSVFHKAFTKRSIALWFKAARTDTDQVIFEQGTVSKGWGLRLNAGTLEGRLGTSATIACTVPFTDTAAWHHVALVYDAGTLVLFLDGQEVKRASGSVTSIPAQSDPAALGSAINRDIWNHCLTSGYERCAMEAQFTGFLDEIMVFSRALSAADVSTLFSSQPPKRVLTIGSTRTDLIWECLKPNGQQADRTPLGQGMFKFDALNINQPHIMQVVPSGMN